MFQRQYEDDAEVLEEGGGVLARGYARLVLATEGDVASWRGTFRVTEPLEPPSLEGVHPLRLRGGEASPARFAPTEDVQGQASGAAGTFFDVSGEGPPPF